MTFTNRVGQDMFMKFCSEDVPKILHASDSRTSFVHRETGGLENLQVSSCLLLECCYPVVYVSQSFLLLFAFGKKLLAFEISSKYYIHCWISTAFDLALDDSGCQIR